MAHHISPPARAGKPANAPVFGILAKADALALAVLRDLVERLRKALERKRVRGLGALGGGALDHGVRRTAHRLDHLLLLGGVLDPEAVALGVHRKARAADLQRRFRTGLERIADHD